MRQRKEKWMERRNEGTARTKTTKHAGKKIKSNVKVPGKRQEMRTVGRELEEMRNEHG